jgi:L-threonylcarbamoyladenylate synthase
MSSYLEPFIQQISNGEVVAIPTETVYGLAAHIWNPVAIDKVFRLKNRPSDNPLIVHIAQESQLADLVSDISPLHRKLINQFWPGPLTILFPKQSRVLSLVTAGLPTVAVRMPKHPITLELIRKTGPVVAPSANISGTPSATKPDHVLEDFGSDFPVLDGGSCEHGLESTVVEIVHQTLMIHRPGAISADELSDIAPLTNALGHGHERPKSPGQKYRHYAPKARVQWMPSDRSQWNEKAAMIIRLQSYSTPKPMVNSNEDIEYLDWNGNWEALAKNLYDCFRRADQKKFESIYIQDLRGSNFEHPLKEALINRIEKAIARV